MKIIHIVDGEVTGPASSPTLALTGELRQDHDIVCVWLRGGKAQNRRKVLRAVSDEKPDLLYCCGSDAAYWGEKISKEYAIPFVIECFLMDLASSGWRIKRRLRRADCCVASGEQASTLIDLGVNPARIICACKTARQLDELYNQTVRQFARRRAERDGAVICGAYGRGNSGDDAILNAIIHELHEIDPDLPVCVMSRQPQDTKRKNNVQAYYTFDLISLWRALRHTSVFISGGGSLIQNATSSRSLYYYLLTLQMAAWCGCKVMMYGCGIGPVRGAFHRWVTAHIINRCVHVVTLRDDDSVRELKRMGIEKPNTVRTADPTICIQQLGYGQTEKLLQWLGIPRGGAYIGFGLREWRGFDRAAPEIAKAARYAWQRHGLTPVFIPIEYPHDCEAAKKAANRLHCPHFVIEQNMTIHETISVLSRMSVVVGMRLHSLIFAVENGVPSIGISYDMKVDGFLRSIDREDVTLHVESVTADELIEQIDRAVRVEERIRWKQTAQQLTAEESGNLKQVRMLLESIPQQNSGDKKDKRKGES